MKYKVGDKVRILKNLKTGQYGSDTVVSNMLPFAGEVVTIASVFDTAYNKGYRLEETAWNWTDEMIEGLASSPSKINLVYCTFKHSDKRYLFLVPYGVELVEGQKVYADTRSGETIVTTVGNSFTVDSNTYSAIISNIEGKKMQYVTGTAKEVITHEKVPF